MFDQSLIGFANPIERLRAAEYELSRELETRVNIPARVEQAMRARLADIGAAIQWLRGESQELSIRAMLQVDWAHK